MTLYALFTRALPLSGLALITALSVAQAQREKAPYEPSVGQPGKDVVWVPTSQALVDKMLDTAKVTPKDYVIDLGSGDGRTVITAAKRGARALGIEYNPKMVELSRANAAKEGVTGKATFVRGDIFKSDFSKATVLTLFLLPDINLRLRPKILNMKPGTRVVSNSFDMADWTPDQNISLTDDCERFCAGYFWIVPAKVQGTWKLPDGELTLKQDFQMLTGTAKIGGASTDISNAKMTGDQIAFSVGDTTYTGRVAGKVMEGVSKSASGETKWRATRVK
jgi:SAM-dependent methyltransferase